MSQKNDERKEAESLSAREPEAPKTDAAKTGVLVTAKPSESLVVQGAVQPEVDDVDEARAVTELIKHVPSIADKYLEVKRYEATTDLEHAKIVLEIESTADKRKAEFEQERELKKMELEADTRKLTLQAEKDRQTSRAQTSRDAAKHRQNLELYGFIFGTVILTLLIVFGGALVIMGKDSVGVPLLTSSLAALTSFIGGYGLGASRSRKTARK